MRNIIKNIFYLVTYFLRNLLNIFYKFREVSILCYHSINNDDWELSIDPAVFEKQILFLKNKNYYFATLDEIVFYIKNEIDLPRKVVAITFDDGYEDVYTNAFPILTKNNIPATVFVFSELSTEKKFLKKDSNLLNLDQINEMKNSGLIYFGHHSATHSMLETLSEYDLERELNNDMNYKYFAYPGGHYSDKILQAVKNAGFLAAFSIKPGLVDKKNNLFLVKRNVIFKNMSTWHFKLRLTKAISWYMKVARKFKKYE